MGLILGLFSALLCGVIYVRMYKRDLPVPIGKGKAALPAILGFFAPILSTLLVALIGLAVLRIFDRPMAELIDSMLLRSVLASFLAAGLPEEIVKLLIFLLVTAIAKPKNVYEHAMLCAGVGVGFTALEEALYGGGSPLIAVARIPTFALHVVFGIIMGLYIGLARNDRLRGASAAKNTALALILPVVFHTVFDAATTANAALRSDIESVQQAGVVVALAVIIVSVILQFMILSRFRKKSEYYCGIPTCAIAETQAAQ